MDDRRTTAEQAALDAWVPLAPPTGFASRVLAARATARRPRRPLVIASIAAVCVAAAVVVVLLAVPRGDTRTPVAELTRADGPVEREQDLDAWQAAKVGAKLYIGDAIRTADGNAQLAVGGAQIAMSPHTVLRFGSRDGRTTIGVEIGAIDLSGTGSYAFDVGDVRMSGQTSVRVAARDGGKPTIELLVGAAQVVAFGDTVELELGHPVTLAVGAVVVLARDAGVEPIAPVVAAGEMTLEITGKRAERLAAGEATWTAVPPGKGSLVHGSKLRLGAATTATLGATGLAVELAPGARGANAALADDLGVGLALGDARAIAIRDATITVPGGAVALAGTPEEPAEIKLEINPRATRVVVVRGRAKLTGAGEAALAMQRGETAMLASAGMIQVVDVIPSYFDLRVDAGESFVIHDPRGATAVQFRFGQVCRQGGVVELDRDARFRVPRVSAGKDAANHMIASGSWAYRVRCTVNGNDGAPSASGRVAVLRDDGRRPLPKAPGINRIDADGRSYTISYQSGIPNVVIRAIRSAFGFRLHLASGGKEEVFDSTSGSVTIPGSKLHEGLYTYWTERDGVKQDKVSTLKIDFDQTAPQVYIEAPVDGQPWTGDVEVRGAVVAGWTPAIDTVTLPLDKQRRFAAKVAPPAAGALVIQLAHPARGVHYYLRRPK
jgi:hypothetical protein